jgi:mannose-6-phosphate isomerase-like protein (cupin superfamily)
MTIGVLDIAGLPRGEVSHAFEGIEHEGTSLSFLVVDSPPGHEVGLHRHRYDEVFIVQEGRALFVLDGQEHEVGPDQVVVARAGQAHGFRNPGPGRLRQIDVHASPCFVTEWLTPDR